MTQFFADATFSFYADEAGNVYATRNGLRRLVGVEFKTSQLETILGKGKTLPTNAEKITSKESQGGRTGSMTAQVITAGGMQNVEMWGEADIKTIVKYYALKGKSKAIETLDVFIDVGLKVFIHDQTGFQEAHPSVQKHLQWLKLRDDAIQVNQIIMAQGKAVNAFDALNIGYFGVKCSDHKAARFLQEAHRYDNLPDYVDAYELEQLIYLRRKFTRICDSYQERINRAVSDTKVAFVR